MIWKVPPSDEWTSLATETLWTSKPSRSDFGESSAHHSTQIVRESAVPVSQCRFSLPPISVATSLMPHWPSPWPWMKHHYVGVESTFLKGCRGPDGTAQKCGGNSSPRGEAWPMGNRRGEGDFLMDYSKIQLLFASLSETWTHLLSDPLTGFLQFTLHMWHLPLSPFPLSPTLTALSLHLLNKVLILDPGLRLRFLEKESYGITPLPAPPLQMICFL